MINFAWRCLALTKASLDVEVALITCDENEGNNISRTSITKVQRFVSNQESNQLLRVKPRLRLDVNVPTEAFQVWESDLADMSSVQYSNRRHTFFIDRSTRFLLALPLKNKNSASIIEAYRTMFEILRKGNHIK